MRSIFFDAWKGSGRKSVFMPVLRASLGTPSAALIFFLLLGAAAAQGAWRGDFRFVWLALFAVLSFYLVRKDTAFGFLLLGTSWVLSAKSPLPWEGARYFFVKADDVVTVLLLLQWAATGTLAERQEETGNPLTKPILIFLNFALVSMLVGLWSHCIDKPWYTMLNFLKWSQYFVLFFLAFEMKQPLRGLLYTLAGMAAATTVLQVFGFWEHFHPLEEVFVGNYYRLFERPPFLAQANHFGIFLVMSLSFALPFFVWWRNGVALTALLTWSLASSCILTWTYSRMSYLALVLALSVICLAVRRLRLVLASLCLLLAPVVFSSRVWDRVLSMPGSFHGGEFSSSVVARMHRWAVLWESVRQHPLMGTGIGSRERIFYESFWMQLLCETGIVGAALFAGILILGFWILLRHFAGREIDLFKLLAISFFGVFFAMLLNGVTLVNFVITVLAAPFWTCFGFILREAADRNPKAPAAFAPRKESYACRA